MNAETGTVCNSKIVLTSELIICSMHLPTHRNEYMPENAFPNPDQMYDEATALKEQGDLEGAIGKLKEILNTAPNHVLTHSALAVNLQKMGNKEEAVAHAKRVVEIEPEDPFSYTQLSVICQRCGLIPEAEDAMARSRQIQGHQH